MFKSVLPVFLIAVCFSCGSPQQEQPSDTTQAADTTQQQEEEGNPDGDIFVTDALKDAISNETSEPDSISEYGTEEQEENEEHVQVDVTLTDVCGFSGDGKYFAFVQVQSDDGYGPSVGTVYVIDVAKNEWATKPVVYDEQDGDFDTNMQAARDELISKYGITDGKNMGYEYGYVRVNPNNVIIVNEDRYVLDFKSNNGMIELRLKGQGKDILLQKDSKVPASRGHVRRTRLARAYELNGHIAVFVEYDGDIKEGFENSRYYVRKNIVVTAVVPK